MWYVSERKDIYILFIMQNVDSTFEQNVFQEEHKYLKPTW